MQENLVTITIDTYSFITSLKNAGFTEAQAKAVVDEILKINLYNVASKDDIQAVRTDIQAVRTDIQTARTDIQALKAENTAEFKLIRKEIEVAFGKVKTDILWWLIPLFMGLYSLNIFNLFRH